MVGRLGVYLSTEDWNMVISNLEVNYRSLENRFGKESLTVINHKRVLDSIKSQQLELKK